MRKSYLFILGMIALIFIVFGVYFPTLTRYRNLKTQEEEMDVKIKALDEKIKSLAEERDLLKHDRDYLEKVIRKELGLVKPGEIVYKFVTEPFKKQPKAKTPVLQTAAEEAVSGVSGTRPVAPPQEKIPPSVKYSVKVKKPVPESAQETD